MIFSLQGDCNAGPESDKVNFGLWAKELSEAFKPKGLLLSAAVSAGKSTIDMAYDVPVLGQYLDFINVMSYDFRGHWDDKTGHHSPLFHHSNDDNNYMNTVNFLTFYSMEIQHDDLLLLSYNNSSFNCHLCRLTVLIIGWRMELHEKN